MVNPSRPLSFSGACFSLLSGHFSGVVQIRVRGTFGRLISIVILDDLDFIADHTIYRNEYNSLSKILVCLCYSVIYSI